MTVIRRSFKFLSIVGLFVTILLILFSFCSPWFQPADSISHFRWHLSLLLLIQAVPAMLLLRWPLTLLILLLAAGSYASTQAHVYLHGETNASVQGNNSLILMQFNLSFRNRQLNEVLKLVKSSHADVITLQEVTRKTGKIIASLANEYPFHVQCAFSTVGGVAVLSRYPLQATNAKGCIKGQGLAWLRVLVNGTPITLAAVHLHWPYPYQQHQQISRLLKPLTQLPQPLIIAGDFNAAAWSHAINRLTEVSHTRVVDGLLFSFHYPLISNLPPLGLPIDHLLLPDGFTLQQIRLGAKSGSDHHALIATISFNK